MVAYAGFLHLCAGESETLKIEVRARWPLGDLGSPDAAP